jgi:hypothetical protein
MKKVFTCLFFLTVLSAMTNAAEEHKSIFSIGINAGLDDNINAYRLNPNLYGNEFSNNKTYQNIALDFGVMTGKNTRLRLEFKYLMNGYKANWDKTTTPSLFTESVVNLKNIDINLHLDFLLLNKGKFQLFISPAFKWEFNYKHNYSNTKSDGTTSTFSYNEIFTEYPNDIIGGAVSAIFKYNITKNIGVILSPEYTIFGRNYVLSNTRLYQRASGNFGFEFKF